MQISFDNIIF